MKMLSVLALILATPMSWAFTIQDVSVLNGKLSLSVLVNCNETAIKIDADENTCTQVGSKNCQVNIGFYPNERVCAAGSSIMIKEFDLTEIGISNEVKALSVSGGELENHKVKVDWVQKEIKTITLSEENCSLETFFVYTWNYEDGVLCYPTSADLIDAVNGGWVESTDSSFSISTLMAKGGPAIKIVTKTNFPGYLMKFSSGEFTVNYGIPEPVDPGSTGLESGSVN